MGDGIDFPHNDDLTLDTPALIALIEADEDTYIEAYFPGAPRVGDFWEVTVTKPIRVPVASFLTASAAMENALQQFDTFSDIFVKVEHKPA